MGYNNRHNIGIYRRLNIAIIFYHVTADLSIYIFGTGRSFLPEPRIYKKSLGLIYIILFILLLDLVS